MFNKPSETYGSAECIILRAQFLSLEKKELKGTISREAYVLEKNIIHDRLLNILKQKAE